MAGGSAWSVEGYGREGENFLRDGWWGWGHEKTRPLRGAFFEKWLRRECRLTWPGSRRERFRLLGLRLAFPSRELLLAFPRQERSLGFRRLGQSQGFLLRELLAFPRLGPGLG